MFVNNSFFKGTFEQKRCGNYNIKLWFSLTHMYFEDEVQVRF
jgi:hypothetical protein